MRNVLLLIGLCLSIGVASAQTFGEITGEVKDPSGAAAPNASVTVTNTATNVSRSTTSNDAGVYSFPDLVPGTYQVKVVALLVAGGIANYNGLAVKLSQRLGANLTTLFSYTWSKALDESSAIRGVANDFAPENMRCRTCEYGIASFNVPHRFVASILCTLPFGKGQRFLNHGGVVNQLVGGWQFSTITTIQNGLPIDTTSWDSAGTNFNPSSNRINCVAGNQVLPNPTANFYFNPAAFQNTTAGQFGSCARNNLIGPHQVNIDFSTIKDFRVTESQALQFPMEMFNAPNHVEWGSPNASWGNQNAPPLPPSSSFGQIRSPRQACDRSSSR